MTKEEIRKHIAKQKKLHDQKAYTKSSFEIFSKLETLPGFISAEFVLAYHSLPDEVYTHTFLDKWAKEKTILLPVVNGNELKIRKYSDLKSCKQGVFSIMEPFGSDFDLHHLIDFIIVPGVAFDLQCNRLGRGKGFYDKFLSSSSAIKIGVCFDFQLMKNIPISSWDIPMDSVLTEERCIVNDSL